jgi:hypothetical protein
VEQSTGFQAFSAPVVSLSAAQQAVVDEANTYYQLLLAKAIAE